MYPEYFVNVRVTLSEWYLLTNLCTISSCQPKFNIRNTERDRWEGGRWREINKETDKIDRLLTLIKNRQTKTEA